jgi:GT2 family glycosyltransferase
MVRRSVLTEMGSLDPVYAPAYYEETDLCARLWQRDLRVVYDPAIVVIHLEFGTSRNPDAPRAQMRRNRDVFVARHREWLAGSSRRMSPSPITAESHRRKPAAGVACW